MISFPPTFTDLVAIVRSFLLPPPYQQLTDPETQIFSIPEESWGLRMTRQRTVLLLDVIPGIV